MPLDEIPARLHAIERPVDAIAAFAEDVLEAVDEDDHVAGEVVDDAADELVLLVAAASRFAGADGARCHSRLAAVCSTEGRRSAGGLTWGSVAPISRSRHELLIAARWKERHARVERQPGRYGGMVHRWRQEDTV